MCYGESLWRDSVDAIAHQLVVKQVNSLWKFHFILSEIKSLHSSLEVSSSIYWGKQMKPHILWLSRRIEVLFALALYCNVSFFVCFILSNYVGRAFSYNLQVLFVILVLLFGLSFQPLSFVDVVLLCQFSSFIIWLFFVSFLVDH